MGFEIIHGYDSWMPAVETFNHNFDLNCTPKNILDFNKSVAEIQSIPDTDIIIGSPPCVSFSSSNRSGKADKSLGVELTETSMEVLNIWQQIRIQIEKQFIEPNIPLATAPDYTDVIFGL